jgi:hypothetical protein
VQHVFRDQAVGAEVTLLTSKRKSGRALSLIS